VKSRVRIFTTVAAIAAILLAVPVLRITRWYRSWIGIRHLMNGDTRAILRRVEFTSIDRNVVFQSPGELAYIESLLAAVPKKELEPAFDGPCYTLKIFTTCGRVKTRACFAKNESRLSLFIYMFDGLSPIAEPWPVARAIPENVPPEVAGKIKALMPRQ